MCSQLRTDNGISVNFVWFCFNRDNDIKDVIDNTFCLEYEAYGEIKVHELKPGGKDVPVTEDNKKEYVRWVEFSTMSISAWLYPFFILQKYIYIL